MFRNRTATDGPAAGAKVRWAERLGLSGKLFAFTVVATMLAEVVFYVPSIANFRIGWLTDRLAAAHTAAIVLKDERIKVPDQKQHELLDSIGTHTLAMRIDQTHQLLAANKMPTHISQ